MGKLYHQDERYIDKFKNTSCYTNLTSRILSAPMGGNYYGPSEGQYTACWQYEPRSKSNCICERMCDAIREELYAASNNSCILVLDLATEWYKQQIQSRVLRKAMKSMTLKELIEYKCRDYGNFKCVSTPAEYLDSKTPIRSESCVSLRIAEPIKHVSTEFRQQIPMTALRKAIKSMTLKELIEYKCRDYGNFIRESPPAECLDSKTPLRSEPCVSLWIAEPIKSISPEFKQQMPMTALRKAMKSMTLKELIEYKCRSYGNIIRESPPAKYLDSKTPIRSESCDSFQAAESLKRISTDFKQQMQIGALRKAMKSMTLKELIQYKCRDYGNIIYESPPAECLDAKTPIRLGSSDSFKIAGTIKRISPEFLELLREHDMRLRKMGILENASVVHQHRRDDE